MLQHATRRALATSPKHVRVFNWSATRIVLIPYPQRSTVPTAASDFSVWANPDPSLAIGLTDTAEDTEALAPSTDDNGSLTSRSPTVLGRELARMVRSSEDALHPEVVDLMLRSHQGSTNRGLDTPDTLDAFALIARAHGRVGRPHLTLHLCEAVRRHTGEPLVPRTPRGLVLLLEAMQPKVVQHAEGRKVDDDGASDWAGGQGAVQELLRRFESAGNAIPVEGYVAAVKALNGPGLCSAALEMAWEARSKLGASAEGMDEVYSLVMRQCAEQRDPDVMRTILREREDAGGLLAPDTHSYATTLACLGKAGRVSEALDLLDEMVERGRKPDKVVVNNVLAACARDASNYWKHAKALFEGMETRWGVTPNVYHYTSLVTCLLKAGQWSDGVAMTDKMEVDGITPNVRFLEHMMQASVGARQWVTAEAIFRAMTEKYGHAAVVSKQSTLHFIRSMVMQKKLRKVISYVARIQNIPLQGPRSTSSLDAHVLRCFRNIPGVGSEALAGVLMTMADQGVKLHPDSYSVVISKANRDGNRELSESLYKMLIADDRAPSLSAANAAIKGCKDVDSAQEILHSLGEHNLMPDKFTYAALLHCCSKAQPQAKAQGDERQWNRDKATEVWEAMLGDGIVPHGGMLASYLQALMKAGDWKAALEMRERYRGGDGLSRAEKHVDKLDLMSREDAVVDGVLASGLVDNGQPRLALEYVLEVLRARSLVSSLRTRFPDHPMERKASERDAQQHIYFVDEDNHTVLAGIRACQLLGSYETAMVLLTTCEARWARGPLARELNDVATGAEAYHNWDWRDITVRTRESRRRVYDCLLSLMDDQGAKWSDIRRVLEGGMRNGAVSLLKDQQGGNTSKQALDFHGWSPRSARCVIRCIVEDIARDADFLLSNGQYDLGRAVTAQILREFGDVTERWHADSPDPRGRRREFADGARPARFDQRQYGEGNKGNKGHEKGEGKEGQGQKARKTRAMAWGEGENAEQAFWWRVGARLSIIVGKPRQPPSIRHSLEEFCTLGVRPPLRLRQDTANPGILNIEPEDVEAWLQQGGAVLEP